MIIAGCISRLNMNNSEMHDLLVDYYIFRMTFMSLAKKHQCSDGHIGKKLQKAEGIVEGMLMMLDVQLEMDCDVQHQPGNKKVTA
ncbi:Q protein [Serratia sp. M24T3]|nr:Q protein [Serratia sp. M24T3]